MNKLDTVNMLLSEVGMTPVTSTEAVHPDVESAIAVMERVKNSKLRRGWWFNTDKFLIAEPASDNKEIVIANSIRTVVAVNKDLIRRNGKLYDKVNQTYKFDSAQELEYVIRELPWDECDEAFQDFCGYEAAAQFVRAELEDAEKEMSLKKDAATALVSLQDLDLEMGQYNVYDIARVKRARAGVRPYRGVIQ